MGDQGLREPTPKAVGEGSPEGSSLAIRLGGGTVTIDRKTVNQVARLARLDLSEDERTRFAEQLGRILEYCAKLDELDTSEVEPTSHVIAMTNVFRDDVVAPSLPRDAVLASAPAHESGFFKVPPVIETEPQP